MIVLHVRVTRLPYACTAGVLAAGSAAAESWMEVGGKLYERMAALAIAYLDTAALPFADYVPYFLDLFVQVRHGADCRSWDQASRLKTRQSCKPPAGKRLPVLQLYCVASVVVLMCGWRC